MGLFSPVKMWVRMNTEWSQLKGWVVLLVKMLAVLIHVMRGRLDQAFVFAWTRCPSCELSSA